MTGGLEDWLASEDRASHRVRELQREVVRLQRALEWERQRLEALRNSPLGRVQVAYWKARHRKGRQHR